MVIKEKKGSSGGGFNTSSAAFGSAVGGDGGDGGDPCTDKDGCRAEDKQDGDNGEFGEGGGSAGGGGGDEGGTPDAARHGGDGGDGGFGAGGGGGGGGGGDDTGEINEPEPGSGGSGGSGGSYGGDGTSGNRGHKSGDNGGDGGDGGYGGVGAGLGGAIFVRETEGANLQLSSSSFASNSVVAGTSTAQGESGQAYGTAIFALRNEASESDTSNQSIDDPTGSEFVDYNTTGDNLPTLSFSLVNLDNEDLSNEALGDKQYKVLEGERINLKLSVEGGTIERDQPVYFYLSQTDALAQHGRSEDPRDIAAQKDADFAWDEHIYYEFRPRQSIGSYFYLSIPYHAAGEEWTNDLGAYSGIQTYIDKLLEGDEDFTIDLLPGQGYKAHYRLLY